MLIQHEHLKEAKVMYNRILLPLDGSPLAEQALPHAMAIAERFQSELVLLRVLISLPKPLATAEAALQRAEKERVVFVPRVYGARRSRRARAWRHGAGDY